MYQKPNAQIIIMYFCKQFDQNDHFCPFEFSSAGIIIGVAGIILSIWINLGSLNNMGQP